MAKVKYVVHGGCVGCGMGTLTTTLVGTSNSKIGGKLRILEPDTGTESFAGDFGICATLTAQNNGVPTACAMSNIPKWINTNSSFLSGSKKPCVTMSSFTVCTAGGGAIVPLKDGQTMEDFSFCKFGEGLPHELQAMFKGIVLSHQYGVDPVNMSTGNFIYSKEDIEIPGRFPIEFKRFYNAIDDSVGVLGRNWTHNYNIFLQEEGRNVKVTFDDGHVEEYYRRDDGSFISPSDHNNDLTHSSNGYYLTVPSMEKYNFDNRGCLVSIADMNGNTTNFLYKNGLLAEINNICGSLSFIYNKDNRIIQISDNSGKIISYNYEHEFLVSVSYPSGAEFHYEYGANGKISNIINPLGIIAIHNEYDDQNRTVKQCFADGGFATMKYDEQQFSTITTEQNGNKVVYVHDEDFRTTKIIYEDSEERFEYNKNNKRILHVDRNGNSWAYAYDERGNIIKETDPLGGTSETIYNEFNRPITNIGPNKSTTCFEYDPKGNLIKLIDPLQRKTLFEHDNRGFAVCYKLPDKSENKVEYDERGNILAIVDTNGNKVLYKYDDLNRVIKTLDGEGYSTLFEYNDKGDITKVTNSLGYIKRYEYNVAGKIIRIIDYDGSSIEYKYNALGKVEEIINQAGGSTKFTYDLMWNVTSVTDPNGNAVSYVYDQYQRVAKSVDEEGSITTYEHDFNGNVVAVVNPMGAKTEIKFDALNRQREIIEPDGAIVKFEYDNSGNIVKEIDSLGNVTEREYDLAGQLTCLTDALGNKTEFTYTSLGQVESVTDANGGKQLYCYYPGGMLKSVLLPCGESETYEYDKNGNIVKVIDALENETLLIYDCLERVREIINPLGNRKIFDYDAVGNITQITDEKGCITQYKYSLLGDIVEVIDAMGHSTKFGYDGTSRLTKVEQYRLIDDTIAGIKCTEYQVTTYERNKKGEIVAVISPLGKVAKYGYDKSGNVISKLDEDSYKTLYEYNLVGKLTKVSYADGKTVEFSYNTLRQLISMKDWLGKTRIELDELGRVKTITDFEDNVIQYEWDALGQKEKIIYPDNSEVYYKYNASGRLQSVTSDSGVTNYAYDKLGRLTERVLPDSTTTKYELNALGRLTTLTHQKADNVLDRFNYSYDSVGNITRIEKHRIDVAPDNGVFEYTYDPLGRLVAAIHGDSIKRYRYDELGNRISALYNGETITHSYNKGNQLIRTNVGEAVKEYRYDGRGNLTAETENGLLKAAYTFDTTNILVESFTSGKGKAEYTYNGFKKRIKKLENYQTKNVSTPDPCQEVRYILDMTLPYDNLLMTRGAQNQNFIWGNELLEATGEEKFCYLQDHLNSPIRLFQENKNNKPLAYDEFGVPSLLTDESLNQPFGFTGYQFDNISGMCYAQARYHNPIIGRMISKDSVRGIANKMPNGQEIVEPASLNLYAYCSNNPISYYDPSGNVWETLLDIGSIAWSAADMIKNPSWANLGFLLWDVGATVVPFAPGSYVAKGGKLLINASNKTDDVVRAFKALSKADRLASISNGNVIMAYKDLRKISQGLGLHVHHLVEKRFAKTLGLNADEIISIAIDKKTHKNITKLMREKIPYDTLFNKAGKHTNNVSPQEIWDATKEVYKKLGITEYLDPIKQQLIKAGHNLNWGTY